MMRDAHVWFLLSAAYPGSVAPLHRADLEASGLHADIITEQRIMSIPPNMFDRVLGFRVPAVATSLLLFPYPDFDGGFMDMFQVKLFPRLTDDGPKYLQPRGTAPRFYLIRSVLPRVLDPTVPLYLVEGAKKALAAAQLGLAAVGFNGIHGWHTRHDRALLDDFVRLPIGGRRVELVPDGDVATNPAVESGAAEFAEALEARGAQPRLVMLPVAA